jgi:hypothetical protein
MMRILRAHQFIKGISHCYRPKTASADGINRAIRVRSMEEFTHRQHRLLRSDLNSKYFAVSDFLLTPIDKHLTRQSFQYPVNIFAFYSPILCHPVDFPLVFQLDRRRRIRPAERPAH